MPKWWESPWALSAQECSSTRLFAFFGGVEFVVQRLQAHSQFFRRGRFVAAVTLDRSLCCWHAPLELVDSSAGMAQRLYGLVFPRDTWWVRYGWRTWGNVRQIMKRSGLRLVTPRAADIEAILARHDLHPRYRATSGVWQVALFAKGAGPD